MPVALDAESAPEPDLVVVAGTRIDYRESHPARVALIVEVADSSLDFDRQPKGSLYARAGVEDYWIVNLIDRVVEMYRDPGPDASAPYGWRYRSAQTLTPSPTTTTSACGRTSSGQESACSPPSTTFAPRRRYHSASS